MRQSWRPTAVKALTALALVTISLIIIVVYRNDSGRSFGEKAQLMPLLRWHQHHRTDDITTTTTTRQQRRRRRAQSIKQVEISVNLDTPECPTELGGMSKTSPTFTLLNAPNRPADTSSSEYWFEWPVSASDRMCTLVQVGTNGMGDFLIPVARTYSGNDWEVVAGRYADQLQIDCSSSSGVCRINLGVANRGNPEAAAFQLTSFRILPDDESFSERNEIARFLEQTTFGPTTETITELQSPSDQSLMWRFANWVKTQQNVDTFPIYSHRALYRRHLNARADVPSPMGAVTQPCQAGTRYHDRTFNPKDMNRYLQISEPDSNGKITFRVDGQLRNVVQGPLSYWSPDTNAPEQVVWPVGSHRICSVDSRVRIDHPTLGICRVFVLEHEEGYSFNPQLNGADLEAVADSDEATFLPIPLDVATYALSEGQNNREREIVLQRDLARPECESGLLSTKNRKHSAFVVWNNQYYIHDPRFQLLNNPIDNPLPDGGGTILEEYGINIRGVNFDIQCANAPRTFVNQDSCVLSNHPNVCQYELHGDPEDDGAMPSVEFEMTESAIRDINRATREGGHSPSYLYTVEGLRVEDDDQIPSPCVRDRLHFWIDVECSNNYEDDTHQDTRQYFSGRITNRVNDNPYFRTFYMSSENTPNIDCHEDDVDKKGFEVPQYFWAEDGRCWRHIHPDQFVVFDFINWVSDHPGNNENRNPIAEVADEDDDATIEFPSWHDMGQWQTGKRKLRWVGRLGNDADFFQLNEELRTLTVAEALDLDLSSLVQRQDEEGVWTMVCGSPFEVANDPFLGGSVWAEGSAFDASLGSGTDSTAEEDYMAQRKTVWTKAVLEDAAQFRQRVAWALSQILVISPFSINDGERMTEGYLAYYDIMLRHAFGNYRDILKEVSYSTIMADMLTYYGGRSTASVWELEGNLEFADENYAREIMQLFTTGTVLLHLNGTAVRRVDGVPEQVYTNDEIEEYARAWTGFRDQRIRGNAEQKEKNYIDPMRVEPQWRDRLPKMGLNQTYVGDGYPLCADLPAKHFLRKGAVYQLLGTKSRPELHVDPAQWESDSDRQMMLEPGSPLFWELCGTIDGVSCSYADSVVLSESLECWAEECNLDTVRTVNVAGIFYEYVRPACAYQAFYSDAKTIVPQLNRTNVMCGDPRTETGFVCCEDEEWEEEYFGERTLFATAQARCGGNLCTSDDIPSCDDGDYIDARCLGNVHFWTAESCTLMVAIDKVNGKVGVVHEPSDVDWEDTAAIVRDDTKTFFRVEWEGDFQGITSNCGSIGDCSETDDGMCLCAITVVDEQVFFGRETPSYPDVLSSLHIGAFVNEDGLSIAAPGGSPGGVGGLSVNINTLEGESARLPGFKGSVSMYNVGADGSLTPDSIFQYVDENGRRHLRKNVKSRVVIAGTAVAFRNPVHLVSISDPEPRDIHHETDATLDHYIYHPNTAPFLALQFAQRFGVSNPSPRYIREIARAFVAGSYTFLDGGTSLTFGRGEYGDLASTFACVVLDREARDIMLNNDPAHGTLREPLLKVLGLMRSLKFQLDDRSPFLRFDSTFGPRIGQMAHEIPNVFSFFRPEHQPAGVMGLASLVAPEALVLTGPRIVNSLNGLFSMIKFGLNECFGGFGRETNCDGWVYRNSGTLSFEPQAGSSEAVVSELATLLTAGRLSRQNRQLIEAAHAEGGQDALKIAAQLVAAAPEFHVTNSIKQSGKKYPEEPERSAPTNAYKALVYLHLPGGVDSFNMLAPHRCSGDLLEQYEAIRTTVKLTDDERMRIIDATGQPCDQFAIHPKFPLVERLYKEGDLAFFANVGQLDAAVNKENYYSLTKSQLFAHNAMQHEAQRVDPLGENPNTGILGRMCDELLQNGYNCQSITVDDATVATLGGMPGLSFTPLSVVGGGKLDKFAMKPESETFDVNDFVGDLNNATWFQSSVFGKTWSERLLKAIKDANELTEHVANVQLTQTYPTEHNEYIEKMKALSNLILTQRDRGADRDVLFVQLGAWDHHQKVKSGLSNGFEKLDEALSIFEAELRAQGGWDQVTIVVNSEFGRTLNPNSSEGTDHAWGGNAFMMGGSVKGGQILGDYPADISEDGPLVIGRGRLIPTSSWESMFTSAVQWMGVSSEAGLDYCMPNRHSSGARLFGIDEVMVSQ